MSKQKMKKRKCWQAWIYKRVGVADKVMEVSDKVFKSKKDADCNLQKMIVDCAYKAETMEDSGIRHVWVCYNI